MDLYGPMHVASVNEKKYILVIVDDYSRFTWVKCLRSKEEALNFIIKFLKIIQMRLKVLVRRVRTDNGTEFVNQTLREYYEKVDISHETSVVRSPQQNGVVERHNCTLIEAAHTMLIYAKALLFLWAEAVATACYTQNRSIIRLHNGKAPYELLHDKLPDLSFFHVFGALCYLTNDSENLGKLQPKADIDFDELIAMASEHSSLEPALHEMTPATISSGLVPNPPPLTSFVPPSKTDWDLLFKPQNRRDLPRDIPLDSVVVLRYEKRSKSENKGKVPTEMELVLEQTQQGTSYEVSVSAEGVEELKRKVKIKGEKKEALLTLRQKPEHQSDTQVITVKMEILLEPASNKLMVERFDTSAGNHVKEILLKLNLHDHGSILTDSKVTPTKHGRITKPYSSPRFIANCFNTGYLKMEVKVPDSTCLKDS
ncbi:retrovirus-related pol polyprotein from transposon TNT 1-94 [Tanacetum coccineum]